MKVQQETFFSIYKVFKDNKKLFENILVNGTLEYHQLFHSQHSRFHFQYHDFTLNSLFAPLLAFTISIAVERKFDVHLQVNIRL